MDDVASIERATFAAMPPEALEALPGWLVGLDHGVVGRSRSAVPLRHDAPAAGTRQRLEAVFAAHGLPCVLRLPELPAFEALAQELQSAGYRRSKPTLVQTGALAALQALPDPVGVTLLGAPGPEWASVFLGAGFDPQDGASRLAILQRARNSVFAAIEADGRLVAVGSACFAEDWCGVHGMRTLPAWRGRGLAGRILAAFGAEAQRRGLARAFLQVEAANAPAQALYRRAGFATAWAYAYWQQPAAGP